MAVPAHLKGCSSRTHAPDASPSGWTAGALMKHGMVGTALLHCRGYSQTKKREMTVIYSGPLFQLRTDLTLGSHSEPLPAQYY